MSKPSRTKAEKFEFRFRFQASKVNRAAGLQSSAAGKSQLDTGFQLYRARLKATRSNPGCRERSSQQADPIFCTSASSFLQVPPGYEKLVVSLIPADTGKLEGQTSRVPVRNGICQWNDTVTELVSLAYNERSKAFEPKTYRLLVSTVREREVLPGFLS